MLAHNCAILEIGFTFDRLYDGGDPDYELALGTLVERVEASHRDARARQPS